jgi:hypothetical protein
MTTASQRSKRDSSTSKPNSVRRAKMRTLTLTDEAWAELTRIASSVELSRSAVVESWLIRQLLQHRAQPR